MSVPSDRQRAAHARRLQPAANTLPKPACACTIKGGNAVDAGVAAMFAAAVTEYSHFGFGGEAPILIRTRDGKVHAIAGVGTMPKLATAEFFRERTLQPGEMTSPPEKGGLKGMVPVAGLMPALVPGHGGGRRWWRCASTAPSRSPKPSQPAIELADGLAIDEMRSHAIDRSRRFFELWPTSKAHLPARRPRAACRAKFSASPTWRARCAAWRRPKRRRWPPARNRDGRHRRGARLLLSRRHRRNASTRSAEQNHGLLRYEDMAAFQLQPEERGLHRLSRLPVYKPGFWSQGPAMIEALNILDGYDLPAHGLNSAEYIHTLVEALKLAYADRDTYYGDPKFSKIPVDALLSKEYARRAAQADRAAGLAGFPAGQDRRASAGASLAFATWRAARSTTS